MANDPTDAKIADMQAQLDKVSADIEDSKRKIAKDAQLDWPEELVAHDERVGLDET